MDGSLGGGEIDRRYSSCAGINGGVEVEISQRPQGDMGINHCPLVFRLPHGLADHGILKEKRPRKICKLRFHVFYPNSQLRSLGSI